MFPPVVPAIQPSEVATKLADGWMLLDVRTDDEWAQGYVDGAVHIPMDQLMGRLDELDLSQSLSKAETAERLDAGQERLLQLRLALGGKLAGYEDIGPPVSVVFEGWDASGKGGALKRLVEHLDPRDVGNSRDVLISELSGRGSVVSRAENAGIDLDADAAKRALERIK